MRKLCAAAGRTAAAAPEIATAAAASAHVQGDRGERHEGEAAVPQRPSR